MAKIYLIVGAVLGMLGVMIGAFGAHTLKATLISNNRLDTFETAVKYQFYHALAMLLLGILMLQFEHKAFNLSGYGFIVGIIFFSGSLYALSITGFTKLGAVAPVGGLAFILGWIAMIWGIVKSV